jgi:hypothetical protein
MYFRNTSSWKEKKEKNVNDKGRKKKNNRKIYNKVGTLSAKRGGIWSNRVYVQYKLLRLQG